MRTSSSAPPAPARPATGFRFARRTTRLKPSAIREILKVTESPDVISFAGGLPAPELFPVEAVASAAAGVLGSSSAIAALQYGPSEGYAPLRQWVCEHLARTVGLQATPDRVLIVHGSQQGLDLAARALIDPGDEVLTENPAYLGALQAFQAHEAGIVGLPSDDQGLLPDALAEWLRSHPVRPRLLYLNPNFQNPTGTSLAGERRQAVVDIAAEFGVPILEDDPYGRLRYSGEAVPALSSLPGANGIYLGTTSKILTPGLRVAWLVAPDRAFFERVLTLKQASDLHTSTLTQRIVHETVRPAGWLDAHIDRLRGTYGRRRDRMLAALKRHFPDGCTWTQPDGGLFLWVTLPRHLDATALLPAALAARVAFVPGEPFWVDSPQRHTLRLNFSNATDERIDLGIERLGAVLRAAC